MINFLPLLYEDELLVSVIARYKQMCGMVSKRALEMDLFRIYKRMGRKSVLFPQYLNTLISNLPPMSKLTVEEIILNHTMYPFFTAFLSVERTKEVFYGMADGYGKSIENAVGMAGSKVKSNDYLKYCPLCFREDLQELGESYWRRLPQTPGALYCPKHLVLYKYSNVIITDARSDYLCADEDTCNDDLDVDTYPKQLKNLNLKYIENVSYLLTNNLQRKSHSFIIDFYIDRLRERKLASANGSIYIDELLKAFLEYYPAEYLKIMQSEIVPEQQTNWLRLFVRNNRKNRSPLRHLLFLQFLDIHVSELFNTGVVVGKRTVDVARVPKFNIEERRKEWLKIINENPGLNRSELKRIGKGLHTWIYANDQEWYEEVTPKINKRKKRSSTVDWEKRDKECLALAKKAVNELLNANGKPIRIMPSTIRKTVGAKRWFDNEKLVRTRKFIEEVTEDIDSYRERKIRWAIEEMNRKGERITVYKIGLKAGFGGGNKPIKEKIYYLLKENYLGLL